MPDNPATPTPVYDRAWRIAECQRLGWKPYGDYGSYSPDGGTGFDSPAVDPDAGIIWDIEKSVWLDATPAEFTAYLEKHAAKPAPAPLTDSPEWAALVEAVDSAEATIKECNAYMQGQGLCMSALTVNEERKARARGKTHNAARALVKKWRESNA